MRSKMIEYDTASSTTVTPTITELYKTITKKNAVNRMARKSSITAIGVGPIEGVEGRP
jgi:hypothetical protein